MFIDFLELCFSQIAKCRRNDTYDGSLAVLLTFKFEEIRFPSKMKKWMKEIHNKEIFCTQFIKLMWLHTSFKPSELLYESLLSWTTSMITIRPADWLQGPSLKVWTLQKYTWIKAQWFQVMISPIWIQGYTKMLAKFFSQNSLGFLPLQTH